MQPLWCNVSLLSDPFKFLVLIKIFFSVKVKKRKNLAVIECNFNEILD